MQVTYVPNTYFFEHLADYHVQQKDIARCLGRSEAAVSKDIKYNHFSMLDIERIAELGSFAHGSFMMIQDGSFDHASQVPFYKSPAYRLYRLHSELVSIYKTQSAVAKATGVAEKKLKLLKKTVMDEKLGLVTDPKVLAQFRYHEFLILISHIDNVDPWHYINDENGWFPISDALANSHVPAKSFLQYKHDTDEKLEEAKMAAEDLSVKYSEACQHIQHNEEELKKLHSALKAEQKENQSKLSNISSLKADKINQRNEILAIFDNIKEQLNMMEHHLTPDAPFSAFITAIRREADKAIKKLKP